jgi:hypothetical protein
MCLLLGKNIHQMGKRILERSAVTLTRGYKIPNINLAQKHELGLQSSIFLLFNNILGYSVVEGLTVI